MRLWFEVSSYDVCSAQSVKPDGFPATVFAALLTNSPSIQTALLLADLGSNIYSRYGCWSQKPQRLAIRTLEWVIFWIERHLTNGATRDGSLRSDVLAYGSKLQETSDEPHSAGHFILSGLSCRTPVCTAKQPLLYLTIAILTQRTLL